MATILVVEDSEDTRQMMQDMLRALGHEMIEASDGIEGIRRALSKPQPDLILMDLMMPNASGISALQFMRGTPEFRDIPILVVSAHSDIATIARAGGADDWLAKPIHMDELRKRIDALLKKSGVANTTDNHADNVTSSRDAAELNV